MLLLLIVICEISFWLMMLVGLLIRYLFRQRRLSNLVLMSVPLIDLVLLVASVVDLSREGTVANAAHGLAAVYIGFTVVFGQSTIRWADQWFAYKFSSGPYPQKISDGGPEYILHEWTLFGKALLALAITAILLYIGIKFINQPERSLGLRAIFPMLEFVAICWLILGPIYSMIFKRTASQQKRTPVDQI